MRLRALFLLLGFSAGLPLFMYGAVLSLRLARQGVDVAVIGFFAWVGLLPVFKFAWAPLVDRIRVPGFAKAWGRRRGWIMLAQLGIASSLAGMALTSAGANLALTALFAVTLAFWTATLETAVDGWRITLAPTQAAQAPLVTANLWGYRAAMVAAGSGAVWIAARADWTAAYLAIAAAAFVPFPLVAAMRSEVHDGGCPGALLRGLAASAAILPLTTALFAALGALVLGAAREAGLHTGSNVTPYVLAAGLVPFALLAALLPRIRRLAPDDLARLSPGIAAFVDLFWRYGFASLLVLAFVSLYRMGDVLALALNHPMWDAKGYGLEAIAIADGPVALAASLLGVALGGWTAARWPIGRALLAGAAGAALGNWAYAWLWRVPAEGWRLQAAAALDAGFNGFAGTVFVVYLSLLVNPRYPAAQYAFLAGCAFLLPRLLAGASGTLQKEVGWDGVFLIAGALSLSAALLLPIVLRIKPRAAG